MPTIFEEKKRRIIEQLGVAADQYTDLSPKGSIDIGIRQLIDDINGLPNLVTTSSCAGRVSVYVEGKKSVSRSQDEETPYIVPSQGGKGGGRWLFVSHDPVNTDASVTQALGFDGAVDQIPDLISNEAALIHFKFEAMILHLMTASLEDAKKVLAAGSSAGFRESGVMGFTTAQDGAMNPMVAIRSNGLALDSVIGFIDELGKPVSIVSEQHLQLLIAIANDRFKTNAARIERFRTALMNAYNEDAQGRKPNADREDAETRRARKRAEGLAKQEALQARKADENNMQKPLDEGS